MSTPGDEGGGTSEDRCLIRCCLHFSGLSILKLLWGNQIGRIMRLTRTARSACTSGHPSEPSPKHEPTKCMSSVTLVAALLLTPHHYQP